MSVGKRRMSATACLLVLAGATTSLFGQQTPPQEKAKPSAEEPTPADELAFEQSRIADKYAQLETLIIRMAAVEASSHPRRAALLKRAAKQSADRFTRRQLTALVNLLNQQQLKRAIDGQQEAAADLASLLELLLSENRPDRLKSEQARTREYIKEVERLIRLQKSLQGRNEGGADVQRLAQEQGQLADRTGGLAKKIQENEEGGPGQQDSQPGEEGDQQSDAGGDKDREQGKDKKEDGSRDRKNEKKEASGGRSDEKKAPRKDGEKGSRADGEQDRQRQDRDDSQGSGEPNRQQDGQQDGQGDNQQDADGGLQKQQQQENPARQRIQAAEQKMRQAQSKLEEAQRKSSLQEQEQAKEELEKAKAELEEILRQLREEEVERMLALLEGRFRKMLEMQLKVYEGTTELDKTPPQERDNTMVIRAGRLAFDERKIAVEADKAYTLLLEEGSSVAFPETVDQMREAMRQAADRLASGKVGTITQGIEEEIISTLEELIQALQQAQQELEEQQQQENQMAPAQPQDQPLVDQIAEIKMIRALQMRVNTRTKRYAALLEDANDPKGQAADSDLQDALRKLAEREARIHRITREIVIGKNR